MMNWLIRRFIREPENTSDQRVRGQYGTLGSVVGISVNVMLSLVKFLVGTFTGSVAVTADAANNLSDAGGSIISLISVRLAQKPVDREHPFGHGRMEYLGALGVGMLIIFMGIELLLSGVDSILHPVRPTFGWVPLLLLVFSILMKVWLYFFYTHVGKKIDAATLLAAAKDSLSDVMATSAVVLSMVIGVFVDFPVDGIMGVIVAALVLKAGFDVCKDTIDSLMGGKPDKELGRRIIDMLMKYDKILGTHDLILHDYGPGRCVASVHAEVPADGNLLELHEVIDQAEREISEELNIPICIHMDPIVSGDPETDAITVKLNSYLKGRQEGLMLHDLRRVPGAKQINLVFDVVVPAGYKDVKTLDREIREEAHRIDPCYHCVIHFDVDYYHA
ncbi:MAG: cation diffusion facilitator family transporter [Aristaeellaceae bacterium]